MLKSFLSILATVTMMFPMFWLGKYAGENPAAPLHKQVFFSVAAGIIFSVGATLKEELDKPE